MGNQDNPELTVLEAYEYIANRFFPGQFDEVMDIGVQQVFKKLCRDAGWYKHGGVKSLPSPINEPMYRQCVNFLLAGDIRETNKLDPQSHEDSDDLKDQGISLSKSIPGDTIKLHRPTLEEIANALENDLKARKVSPSLPKVKAESGATKPHNLAMNRYPDEDGSLKTAFCRGLGVDPAGMGNISFVDFFRGVLHRTNAYSRRFKEGRPLASLVVYKRRGLDPKQRYKDDSIRSDGEKVARAIGSVIYNAYHSLSAEFKMTPELAEECGRIIADHTPDIVKICGDVASHKPPSSLGGGWALGD